LYALFNNVIPDDIFCAHRAVHVFHKLGA
jgi:hypothetical protein